MGINEIVMCVDCQTTTSLTVHDSELWYHSEQGWLCHECYNDSWDNDCKDEEVGSMMIDPRTYIKKANGCPSDMVYCPPLGDCQECIKASEERKEDKPEIQVGDCGSHPECHYGDNCNDCMLNQ